MTTDKLKLRIPGPLLREVEQLDLAYGRRPAKEQTGKIVALDMDNTLLVGDIGEAVFIQFKIDEQKAPLKIDGSLIPYSWAVYEKLVNEGRKRQAYSEMVAAMAGIPASVVVETTKRVMNCGLDTLEAEGVSVPVPHPHPIMKALVEYLYRLDYKLYIVSASYRLEVEYVAKEYFNIPAECVVGMNSRLEDNETHGLVLTEEVLDPITVSEGKADAYREFVSDSVYPLITAGDSTTDIQILNLVQPGGLVIWVGGDEKKKKFVKENSKHPELLFFLDQ